MHHCRMLCTRTCTSIITVKYMEAYFCPYMRDKRQHATSFCHMQLIYVNMPLIYVNNKLIYVDMQLNKIMLTCNIILSACKRIMFTSDPNYVACQHIIMLHVDINKSHFNIIMWYVDIIYLACEGQPYTSMISCNLTSLFSSSPDTEYGYMRYFPPNKENGAQSPDVGSCSLPQLCPR